MDFIPYSCQQITDEDIEAVVMALRSEYLTQGPIGPAFEAAFAKHHQVENAVAVSNATAGLHIACLALGVGPDSRVWTSPNTFLASANCALYCGASIDFVDIDPDTRNMSVAALAAKLELAAESGTLPCVVIPVDFAGLPADLKEIRALADQYGFRILQDASHDADASVFSFHAVKIITTAEGGMVTTNDGAVARKLQLLRAHGMTRETTEMEHAPEGAWYYEQQVLGFNYRLTELQAALGLSQLQRIEDLQQQRVVMADRYDQLLENLPLRLPPRQHDRVSSWHLYAIEIDADRTPVQRTDVFRQMREAKIGVNVHYIPVHLQPYYQRLGFNPGDFPAAEQYYRQTISLPLFPAMTKPQQDRVVGVLRQALVTA